jgi:hypothetical protein
MAVKSVRALALAWLFVIPTVYSDGSLPRMSVLSRLALVVGNGAYRSNPLSNPTNDATDMAAALTSLGFKVTLLTDASRRQMKDAISQLGESLHTGGIGLFYFAGHGVQSNGRNFLIPTNADIKSEADLEYEAIDANYVLAQLEQANNQINILVLDACRDNPFARSWRSATRGLAQMDAPAGTFIAFATAPGRGAADGSGRNGTFTKHLLASLQAQSSKLEEVFKRAAASVASETSNAQIPWTASSLTRDFYFRGASKAFSPADLLDMSYAARAAGREEEAKQLAAESDRVWVNTFFPGYERILGSVSFKQWLNHQPQKIRDLAASNDPQELIITLRMYQRDLVDRLFAAWLKEQPATTQELAASHDPKDAKRARDMFSRAYVEATEMMVEQKHPGWKQLITTLAFKKWIDGQPEDIRELANSQSPDDAIAILDLYKASAVKK